MVKDIYSGYGHGILRGGLRLFDPVAFGSNLLFSAGDASTGYELWVTDGSAAGTKMVKDIRSGSSSSYPHNLTVYNSKVYFTADDGSGEKLWVTDGTAAGTKLVIDKNSVPVSAGALPNLSSHFGKLIIDNGLLSVSDGTPAGTFALGNMIIIKGPGDDSSVVEYKGKLYFAAKDNNQKYSIYSTDGTVAGTSISYALPTTVQDCYGLSVMNGKLYYFQHYPSYTELVETDGTLAGIKLVKTLRPKSNAQTYQQLVYKNALYFIFDKDSSSTERRIYRSDGTTAGTKIIQPPGTTITEFSGRYQYLYKHDTSLYISAKFDNAGFELWKLDDTSKIVTPPPPSSIGNIATVSFEIFPNPSHGSFTLQLGSAQLTTGTVIVYDITGKPVLTQQITQTNTTIKTGHLSAGTYNVILKAGTEKATHSIIIE